MGRFETELLSMEENLSVLSDLSGIWIDKVHDRRPPKVIILDMDRYVTFQLAEVAVPRNLFRDILRLIDGLRPRLPTRC